MLEQHDGGYRLGLRLVSLAGFVLNRFPARAIARDVLRELRDEIETVYLGLLDGREFVYIDQASGPHRRHVVGWGPRDRVRNSAAELGESSGFSKTIWIRRRSSRGCVRRRAP